MKKSTLGYLMICLLAVLIVAQPVSSQHMVKTYTSDSGEISVIPGLGAIIKAEGKALVVEMMMPKDNLPEEYKAIDLKKGDVIKMCNGKKMKSMEDFNSIFEKLEVGADVSFAVKRGKDMMMVTFPKADPGESGEVMVMTKTIGGDDKSTMTMNGGNLSGVTVLDVGLVIHETNDKLVIMAELPQLSENIKGDLPEKGDVLISLNGESIADLISLQEKYNLIEVGTDTKMTFQRDEKEFTVSFVKADVSDNEIIMNK